MQEKVRSYLSKLHNAVRSHDPYHMEGILTGRPMNILNVATLNIPEAMLSPLKQAFSHLSQSKVLEYFSCSFLYLSSGLSNLVSSLESHLGSRIVDSREPKAQLGELDTNCNSSSFLQGIMKMADVDIDSFSDHDKMDAQPDETGETIPLRPGGVVVGGGSYLGTRTGARNIIQRNNSKNKTQRSTG